MSKVYVVQKQVIWNGRYHVPKFDLSPAGKFGTLIYLLGPKDNHENPEAVIRMLHVRLADYTADDYLLLIGNPCLIGWTTAIAAKYSGGDVKMLQWSGKESAYVPVMGHLLTD